MTYKFNYRSIVHYLTPYTQRAHLRYMYKNTQLLKDALQAFKETTHMAAEIIAEDISLLTGYADAEIQLGNMSPLIAEIKKTLRTENLGAVLSNLKPFNRSSILITEYTSP
jgi:hypothetical protein